MNTHKFRFALFVLMLSFTPQTLWAQDDYNFYLQKAQQRIDEGDCAGAQKNYNVYKELSGKTLASFEVLIEDCIAENRFRIGDKIDVDGEYYIIAYLTENKQHGFAIKDEGMDNLCNPKTLGFIRNNNIPSLGELEIIYKNNDKIGLTAVYWTKSLYAVSSYDFYYTINFLTGKKVPSDQRNTNGILLIHRF